MSEIAFVVLLVWWTALVAELRIETERKRASPMTTKNEWTGLSQELPPDGQIVNTRIDDSNGVRNEQPLKRQGRLWFTPDGGMYVYYTPTHWKPRTLLEKVKGL